MAKPIIAVDIDNVLSRSAEAFIKYSNARFGSVITLETYSEDWGEMWSTDREETLKRSKQLFKDKPQKDYPPIVEAKEALEQLKRDFTLIAVTSRRLAVEKVTLEWLDRNFEDVFSKLTFTGFFDDLSSKNNHLKTKGEILSTEGASYLIDDQVKHCNAAAELGISALLFGDYPWNRNERVIDGVTRVMNWQDVMEFFEHER